MDSRLHVLESKASVVNQILYEMRSVHIQTDRLRFRTNMKKLGALLAYEISKDFQYQPQQVETPLGQLEIPLTQEAPVLVSILRAGMALHEGFLFLLDRADNGFISAYRKHTKGNEFIIKLEYTAIPPIEGRDLILIDPMIATGRSMVLAAKAVLEKGKPNRLFIAGALASDQGVDYVLRQLPEAQLYVGAVDEELTAKAYIVPGLGDAGDLAYGDK